MGIQRAVEHLNRGRPHFQSPSIADFIRRLTCRYSARQAPKNKLLALCDKLARHAKASMAINTNFPVEVVQPSMHNEQKVSDFLLANGSWILDHLNRVERLRGVLRPVTRSPGNILFRGESTPVRIKSSQSRAIGNMVRADAGVIVVSRGPRSQTPIARSLEHWLRREARQSIESHIAKITARLGRRPHRIYVMDQRTKWGNCSSRRNLSFNWRLILAPDYVLRYIVTHEAVHLAVPDHSPKFWLTVQSLCPEMEKAKQWLRRHQAQLQVNLGTILEKA